MPDVTSTKIWSAAAGGTQNTPWQTIPLNASIGLGISHPAGTTTTYTIQVSDTEDDEAARDIYKPMAYEVTDRATGDPLGEKSAEEDFPIDFTPKHRRWRINMVTTVGTSLIEIWATVHPGDS